MANKKISDLIEITTPNPTDKLAIVHEGVTKSITVENLVAEAVNTADTSAKNYADSLVVGLLNDRGSHDASSDTFPTTGGSGTAGAIRKGDIFFVSDAGTLGGRAVIAGDSVRALVNTPGQTASNWSIIQTNIGYVPEPSITAGTTAQYFRGDKTFQTLDKTAVGLGNVPNIDTTNAENITSGIMSTARLGSGTADNTSYLRGDGVWSHLANGNVLYVSPNGSDSDASRSSHIGNMMNPFLTLKAARDAAQSGDLIYVFPQVFVFDNRDSNGNYYNSRIEDVNLFKNGVSYYFMPGCKIQLYNQTITGSSLYLFRPHGGTFETCSVYGYLEFEAYSVGTNTFNGYSFYFKGDTIDTDMGYNFYSQTRSLTSTCHDLISIDRSAITIADSNVKATITIISDLEKVVYTAGQSGSGAAFLLSLGDSVTVFTSSVRERIYTCTFAATIRTNLSRSIINLFGDILTQTTSKLFDFRVTVAGVINIEIKKMYYPTTAAGNGIVAQDFYGSVGFTLLLKGDLIEQVPSTNTVPLFRFSKDGGSYNYVGNIYTNTTSGAGHSIVLLSSASTINIEGNITYIGNGTSTAVIFIVGTVGSGTLNYKGIITGNFAAPVTNCYMGVININNSIIKSSIAGGSSTIIENGTGGSSLGTVRINSSYVEITNNTNPIANGNFVKIIINNSQIINAGTNNGIQNNSNNGSLQIIGSMIYANTLPINYTGTVPVTVVNSVVNSSYTVSGTLNGSIDLLTSLTF